jgi:hypothetical protein
MASRDECRFLRDECLVASAGALVAGGARFMGGGRLAMYTIAGLKMLELTSLP